MAYQFMHGTPKDTDARLGPKGTCGGITGYNRPNQNWSVLAC